MRLVVNMAMTTQYTKNPPTGEFFLRSIPRARLELARRITAQGF